MSPWNAEFDAWAAEKLAAGDLGALANFLKAPGVARAHRTVDHFVPLLVASIRLTDDPLDPTAREVASVFDPYPHFVDRVE